MSADLTRFLEAQTSTYPAAVKELQRGLKQSHWMWFIFPQIAGLGTSDTARFYAIADRQEAIAYLAHPTLGPRLIECAEILLHLENRTAHQIFGSPDDLKLRSSMTLFATVSEPGSPFHQVIDRYYAGEMDNKTQTILSTSLP